MPRMTQKTFVIPSVPDYPNRLVIVQMISPTRIVDKRIRYQCQGGEADSDAIAYLLRSWDAYMVWLNPGITIDVELVHVPYHETPGRDGVEDPRYVFSFYEKGPISMELAFDKYANESALITEPGSRYEDLSWQSAVSLFAEINSHYD